MTKTRDVSNLLNEGRLITEYGSNANGEYIRYDNGIQIVWVQAIQTLSSQTNRGSSFAFPVSFYDTNYIVTALPSGVAADFLISVYNKNTGFTNYANRRRDGLAYTGNITNDFIVVGRWY